MASTNLGICVVDGITFQVPRMTDAELRSLTKHDVAYKLRSVNSALPCDLFVVDKVRAVFLVMLERLHPYKGSNKDRIALRKGALKQWKTGPGWPASNTRTVEFLFPNDNPSLVKDSIFWCEIEGVRYRVPRLAKHMFKKLVPNVAAFIDAFRRDNIKNAQTISLPVAKEAFRHYILSYFPNADFTTATRLLDQFHLHKDIPAPQISQYFDAQHGASNALNLDTSPLDQRPKGTSPINQADGTADSLVKILPLLLEVKNHLIERKGCVRKIICPRPRLKESNPKSKVTHLHVGTSPTKGIIDLEAIPTHPCSIALVFRSSGHRRRLFSRLEKIEVIVDGDLRYVQVQEVKNCSDFDSTKWYLSVDSMDMMELKVLLQHFFSNRSSLPLSMFCSDEFNILSDGGLFIHCDNLPISLRKYEFDFLSLNIGVGKATSAEPAASCLICNPPARGTDSDSPSEQESDILQNGLLCCSPKYDFKDTIQEASLDHESSIEANTKELPFSISTSESFHATDDPEASESMPKNSRSRKKDDPPSSPDSDIPLPKRPRVHAGSHLPTESSTPTPGEPPSNHTHPESLPDMDLLSALDAHLKQAQTTLRAAVGSSGGGRGVGDVDSA